MNLYGLYWILNSGYELQCVIILFMHTKLNATKCYKDEIMNFCAGQAIYRGRLEAIKHHVTTNRSRAELVNLRIRTCLLYVQQCIINKNLLSPKPKPLNSTVFCHEPGSIKPQQHNINFKIINIQFLHNHRVTMAKLITDTAQYFAYFHCSPVQLV